MSLSFESVRLSVIIAAFLVTADAVQPGVVGAQESAGQANNTQVKRSRDKGTSTASTATKPRRAPAITGELTATALVFREFGSSLEPEDYRANHSHAGRLFSDLRMRLNARRVAGSLWDMRLDARVRLATECTPHPDALPTRQVVPCSSAQSGTFGGNEYDLRELHATRRGPTFHLVLGRQYVSGVANLRLDGLSLAYPLKRGRTLFVAAGLHPARNSRSLTSDYPLQPQPDGMTARPIVPLALAAGASYRYTRAFGSFGAALLVPLAHDRQTGQLEHPRLLITDAGSLNPNSKLHLYHYVVLDLQGAGGFGFTNLNLGAHYRPTDRVTIDAAINRVDAETLNSVAQINGNHPFSFADTIPYNYHDILRVASESARLGVSLALAERRFEVSTSIRVRQRQSLQLRTPRNPGYHLSIPAVRNAEVQLSLLDRRSIGRFRLGASLAAIVPFGSLGPNDSNTQIARILATRTMADRRLQLDLDASVSNSVDRPQQGQCDNPLNCYGNATIRVVSTNALVFYRITHHWTVIANLGVGTQFLRSENVAQPPNLLVTGFGRLGYRF